MVEQRSRFFRALVIVHAILALLISIAVESVAAAPLRGESQGIEQAGWEDHFNAVDSAFWVVEDWQRPDREFGAPGYIENTHLGVYQVDHVAVAESNGNRYLRLLLTQEVGPVDENPTGVISRGALLYTKEKYGYGTYEWRMRMSSTALSPAEQGVTTSGNVSAGFIFVNNSETEIDFEFSGHTLGSSYPETLYMVNWNNKEPSTGPTDHEFTSTVTMVPGLNQEFKTYQFEWKPDGITFSVDGIPQVIHRTDISQAPAHFMINHWGTNNPDEFGGKATIGVERYSYVDWVKFTPER